MDTTTIQIQEDTKEELTRFKQSHGFKTYDEVIKRLLHQKSKSLYGFLAKKKKITHEEIMDGLRDKHDRY